MSEKPIHLTFRTSAGSIQSACNPYVNLTGYIDVRLTLYLDKVTCDACRLSGPRTAQAKWSPEIYDNDHDCKLGCDCEKEVK